MRMDLKRTTNRAKTKGNPSKEIISPYQTTLFILLVSVGIESC